MNARVKGWIFSSAAWWPFDQRDGLLLVSLTALAFGLLLWSLPVAFVTLGVLGLGAWAWPIVIRLYRGG